MANDVRSSSSCQYGAVDGLSGETGWVFPLFAYTSGWYIPNYIGAGCTFAYATDAAGTGNWSGILPLGYLDSVGAGFGGGLLFATYDGTKMCAEPDTGFDYDWKQWQDYHLDADGVGHSVISAEGGTGTDHVGTGIVEAWYCVAPTGNYTYKCLSNGTNVSGWSTTNHRTVGVYAVSATQVYIFVVDSSNAELYFTKYNGSTFTGLTLVSSGSNTISKLHIRPVGAGQTTKLYLMTNDSGKVFVWDYSTEAAVSSSFNATAFPSHIISKHDPINPGGSTYYHFCFAHSTRTLYKWSYTSATYASPTLTTFAVPTAPAVMYDEFFVGFSIEFNNATNECYAVAHWSSREGWKPYKRYFTHKSVEALSGTTWTSHSITASREITQVDQNPDTYKFSDKIVFTPLNKSGAKQDAGILCAYSLGSNVTGKHTSLVVNLDADIFENPDQSVRTTVLTLNFWAEGPDFTVEASVTVNPFNVPLLVSGSSFVKPDGFTGTDAVCTINAGPTLFLDQSFVSEMTGWTAGYTIESSASSYQDAEITISAGPVLTLGGSLLSEDYVNADIVISAGAVLTLDPIDTPITEIVRDVHIPYSIWGTTYAQAFLDLVNAKRDEYGLPRYALPTTQMFGLYTDISQLQATNMATTRTYAHEGANLPSSWDTYLERRAVSGLPYSGENIMAYYPSGFLDYPIFEDDTFPTVQQLFDSWWYSSGHRDNLLRDWGSDSLYSYLSFDVGQLPPGTGNDWVFYFAHVMGRYGQESTVTERQFHATYDLTGALIKDIALTYQLDAYSNVRASHQLLFSLSVTQAHTAEYGTRVAAQHEAPITYGLTASHQADYTGTVGVRVAVESPYRFNVLVPVAQANTAKYSSHIAVTHAAEYSQPDMVAAVHRASYDETPRVAANHVAEYSQLVPVSREHHGVYDDKGRILADHSGLYGQVPYVAASHTANYSVPDTVRSYHTGSYSGLGTVRAANASVYSLQLIARAAHDAPYIGITGVRQAHDNRWNLSATNNVKNENKSFYSMVDNSASQVTAAPTITYGSVTVPLMDAVVESSEGSSVWSATVRLSRVEEFTQITEGSAISITIGGETYSMVVLSKSLSRSSPAGVDLRLSAASPLVLKESPRAAAQSYSFDTPMMAKDIVEAILGQSVTWTIVNWQLPANRVQFQETAPLDAARRVVEAAGGVIQSNKDGTVLVRSLFPTPTNAYATATADHVYTDDDDNLSSSEQYAYKDQYNKFRIMEAETTQGDKFDWAFNEDSETEGVLRFYPSPWRETVVIRTTEAAPSVVYALQGIENREESEVVEFKEGVAGVSNPIKTLVAVEWLSEVLGSPIFTPYSSSLTVGKTVNGGYGVARVTYEVESLAYAVRGVPGTHVQFLAEE